jgi:hypothetical protein
MPLGSKKCRFFVALLFAAGDVKRREYQRKLDLYESHDTDSKRRHIQF